MATKTKTLRKKRKGISVRNSLQGALRYYDYNLLASVILLTCFGLVMLYSTSAYSAQVKFGNDMEYFSKQAAISGACLVGVLIFSQVNYHYYVKFAGILYIVSNVLLFLTKFIGTELNGAKRWIYFGPISFQPAEMAKLAVILFLPVMVVKMGKNMKSWKAFLTVLSAGAFTSTLRLPQIAALTQSIGTAFGMLLGLVGCCGVMMFISLISCMRAVVG